VVEDYCASVARKAGSGECGSRARYQKEGIANMAVSGIMADWEYVWDDGWGGSQATFMMNLNEPSDVLAQITLCTYNPNDGGSYGQGYIQGYIAGGHYVDATDGNTKAVPFVYVNGATSVWFTVNVLQGFVACVANIFTFD
jgi:hypothetical protein